MLVEIICNKFKQEKIEFHEGLNSILGDDIGSNSIGKSTLLMIIDFVFGGKDYVMKSTDIQKNIGNHLIKFSFRFNDIDYFFIRETNNFELIGRCDKNYNLIDYISLDDYTNFLKDKYDIDINEISFRNIVGRYSRIYGKDNLNEKRPLDIIHNEPSGAQINALLMLFNLFNSIKELELLYKLSKDKLSNFKKSQKYNFISSITKTQFNKNLKSLNTLYKEKEELAKDLSSNLNDIDSLTTEEIIKLKTKSSNIKRKRTRYISQLSAIENNIKIDSNTQNKNWEHLLNFFPNTETKKIEEVNKFHIELKKILNKEFKEKKEEIENLINIATLQIETLTDEITDLINIPDLSKIILKKYSNIQKEIEQLEKENFSYNSLESLKTSEKDNKLRRDIMKKEQLNYLQNTINMKMKEINDFIYSNLKKSPLISFDKNSYTFTTPDDTGTGTSHKSMIVYDLSILELTPLPFLIHDSVILKQISDIAIEKIFEKYNHYQKQIFISFDKMSAYSNKSQEILVKTKVLELAPNGKELFGISWNNKNTQ